MSRVVLIVALVVAGASALFVLQALWKVAKAYFLGIWRQS